MTYVQGPATTGSGNLEANKLESGQTSTPDSTSILEIFYADSRLESDDRGTAGELAESEF